MTIKTILIDDEPLAIKELQLMLQKHPEILVVDTASNSDEAIEKINTHQPDLIYLDINLPRKSGFEILEELDQAPYVIFVTAYDQFAIKAFEVDALDYLLKPVNPIRLKETVEKAKKQVNSPKANDSKLTIEKRIFIKDGEHCYFVPLAEIYLIESVGNYSRIYYQKNKPLLHKSLNYLEDKLPEDYFFRIGRQNIINISFIKNIIPHFNNALKVEINNGTILEVSQRQSIRFKEIMGI